MIVPCGITASLKDADKQSLYDACDDLNKKLKAVGIRSKGDYRDNYSPGWKFNHWELKVNMQNGAKVLKWLLLGQCSSMHYLLVDDIRGSD